MGGVIGLADTIGAETIGAVLTLFLSGVQLQQAYRYFVTYPRDRWKFRLLVAVLSILNLANTITVAHALYSWDVIQWGSAAAPNSSPPSFNLGFIFSPFIITIVQQFYAYRVYIMQRNYIIPAIIVFGSIVQLATGLTVGAYGFINPFQCAITHITPVVNAMLATCALVDLIITITVLFQLRRTKHEQAHVQNAIRRIALINIETNAPATTLAIATLIVFTVFPSGWSNMAYYSCIKCYVISLCAVLNARPVPTDLATVDALSVMCTPSILFPQNNKSCDMSDSSNSITLNSVLAQFDTDSQNFGALKTKSSSSDH